MLKKLTVNKKTKAQGLVEFALILTLLLTLLYGILETGRLLFIYASTVTAARQAVRYGSATGNSPAGMPYYRDCAGIRAAAKRVGFLSRFTDADILISYDHGPAALTCTLNADCPSNLCSSGLCSVASIPASFATCEALAAASVTLQTGDRVKVCVSTTWSPIVGALVPLRWGGTTNCSNVVTPNAITKSSERTLLSSVAIGVTALPGTWPGATTGIILTTSASPTTYDHVGQVITITYNMYNDTSFDLKGAFSLISNTLFPTCGAGVILSPGITLTCYGYYTITQADLDAGSVVDTAKAYTSNASSNEKTTTINAIQIKKLTITISPSPAIAPVGALITYTYKVKNSGNITLTSPVYTVTDNKLGAVTCPSPATLAPGAGGEITCSNKTYTILQADVTNGKFENTASLYYALMTPPTPTTQTATATVYTKELILTVAPSITTATIAGQVITYSYSITNNSGSAATAPGITGAPFAVSCPAGPINVGSSITCTATYTVTQQNMDDGITLTHTATASANSGGITSKAINVSVPVVRTDGLALTISATTSRTPTYPLEFPTVTLTTDTFTFNYMLTNTGNTTLTLPYTISPSTIRNGATSLTTSPLTITCGTGELAPAYINSSGVLVPGASTSANFCYSTAINPIANDLNGTYGGYITNLATANATTKFGARNVSSPQQTGVVTTYNGARLALAITANPPSASSTGMPITFTYTLTSTGNIPVTLPTPYSITWTITLGGGTVVAQVPIVCASPITTIPVNTSTTCTGTSSYITTAADGISITNDATAPFAGTNALANATGSVTVTRNFSCDITHSGGMLDTVSGGNKINITSWYIYNKIAPAAAVHINSLTVTWATLGSSLAKVKLDGVEVWTGKTSASGFTITPTTPGISTTPSWAVGGGLPVGAGKHTMELTFTEPTTGGIGGIQIRLGFSETSCGGGLNSANPAQQEPIIGGIITKSSTVTNITLSATVPTITGLGNATCGKTTTVYACSMLNGSGSIAVGAYSTGSTASGLNNKVCVSGASPTGSITSDGTSSENTTFAFSALPPQTIFSIQIVRQGDATPSGYTCYPPPP